MGFKIAPSFICFDFLKLEEQFEIMRQSGIRCIHLDVMDGNFVEQITIGSDVIKQLRGVYQDFFLDTHLMVSDPLTKIKTFAGAGSDCITFHIEAVKNANEACEICSFIRGFGIQCGVAINPETEIDIIDDILKKVKLDRILIMSVKPGLSGQKFIDSSIEKIRKLKNILANYALENKTEIWVDGGLNFDTLPNVLAEGIDGAVIGSALHKIREKNKGRIANFQQNISDFVGLVNQLATNKSKIM